GMMRVICAKTYAALKNDEVSFGRINMNVAGDFVQLPPAMCGKVLYAHNVS
ncbi:hypothetical protein L226DRAFT_469853, partial [Lentinus tigrinus ALCF2SS1-7]